MGSLFENTEDTPIIIIMKTVIFIAIAIAIATSTVGSISRCEKKIGSKDCDTDDECVWNTSFLKCEHQGKKQATESEVDEPMEAGGQVTVPEVPEPMESGVQQCNCSCRCQVCPGEAQTLTKQTKRARHDM